MTDQHPITPPPELVQQWIECCDPETIGVMIEEAAQWGADQELEACCELLPGLTNYLRKTRRPKQPSLKEQALDAWDRLRNEAWCEEIDFDLDFVRRALEALDD
jgi:hypothetical protein